MRKKSEEIYSKLFQALEEGKKKGEISILKHLRKKYKIPWYRKVSRFLADRIPEEEVFTEIVNYLAPFSQILRDIYLFLDRHRSTIQGKTDQFAFRFEEIANRVPFGLDSFPKTYVDVLRTGQPHAFHISRSCHIYEGLVIGEECAIGLISQENHVASAFSIPFSAAILRAVRSSTDSLVNHTLKASAICELPLCPSITVSL